MPSVQRIRGPLWFSTLILLSSCGGGGPGVRGLEAVSLFRSYTGSWVLNDSLSAEVPAVAAGRGGGPGGGGGGGAPRAGGGRAGGGGRGGGGAPPGGAGGRGGGGGAGPGGGAGALPGGGLNPGAVQATAALARARPPRMELLLTDSLFTADYEGGRRTEVPMIGDEVDLVLATWPGRAKVEWKDRRPSIRWRIEDGGRVTDRYELPSADRLILTRVFNAGQGGDVEVRFVYDRAPAPPGAP